MNDKKKQFKYLTGGISSKILFTILVYGSEEKKWLSQKDIKAVLCPKGSGRSSVVFNELVNTKLFFNYMSEERFICEYKFYDKIERNVPYIIKNNKFFINWTDNKQNEWVYVPKYDWLNEFFGFKLTDTQMNFIKNIFLELKNKTIKNIFILQLFNKNNNIDLLEIIKNKVLEQLRLSAIGYSMFGNNLETYQNSYQERLRQYKSMDIFETGYNQEDCFFMPIFDMEKEIGIKINNQNFLLLNQVLGQSFYLSKKEILDLSSVFINFKDNTKNGYLNVTTDMCYYAMLSGSTSEGIEIYKIYDTYNKKINVEMKKFFGGKAWQKFVKKRKELR